MIHKLARKIASLRVTDSRRFLSADGVASSFDLLMDAALNAVDPGLSSKSQLKQDVVALVVNAFKRDGFFVEFGAANGVHLSNTYLLEKKFGWNGILAEPAKIWHPEILASRNARLDKRCVWKSSDCTLEFIEAPDAELSTVTRFMALDMHREQRALGKTYRVESVSLNDLLSDHSAPAIIDYLSMDTEGSELEILKGFDFNKHRFNFITCEHNFSRTRSELVSLLSDNGYVRVLNEFSRWDDWFVPEESDFFNRLPV
jgi:FkbM family methyltransferase